MENIVYLATVRDRAISDPLSNKDYSLIASEKFLILQISAAILNFGWNQKCCLS